MHREAELDDPPALASLLGLHQAVHGDCNVPFDRLETAKRVTVDDVRAAARRLFDGLRGTAQYQRAS